MAIPKGSEDQVPWFEKQEAQDAEKMAAKENWGIWTEQYALNYSQQLEEKSSREWEEYEAFEYGILIIGAILFFVLFTFVVMFASLWESSNSFMLNGVAWLTNMSYTNYK